MNNPYQQPQARNPYLDPTAPTNTPSVGAVPPDGAPPEPLEEALREVTDVLNDLRASLPYPEWSRLSEAVNAYGKAMFGARPSEPGTTA
jgi:hypothetical protein